jgi:hypothetical protein
VNSNDEYQVGLPDDFARGHIEELQRQAQQSLEPVLRAATEAAEAVKPLLLAERFTSQWIESHRKAILEATERVRQVWEDAIPPNIRDLDVDVLGRVLDIAASTGPCMVWVPRAEIVEAAAAGDYSQQSAILIDHRGAILDDLCVALDDATVEADTDHGNARRFALVAVAAARDGHDDAAQALSAAGLGCIVHGVLDYKQLANAREELAEENLEDAYINSLRLLTIRAATSRALIKTIHHVDGFNRHGTLHGIVSFYGEAEMLGGLLLLVAWVRELSWWAKDPPEALEGNGS